MIVPGFNIFKNIQAHFIFGSKFSTIDQFRFERFEETLCHSIIPAITFTTHALASVQRFQHAKRLFACILNTSVRMKDHLLRKRAVPIGHPNSWCLWDVSNIRNTGLSRLLTIKIPIQQIGRNRIVVRRISSYFKSFRKLTAQSHLLHVACNCILRYRCSRHPQIPGQTGASVSIFRQKICFLHLFVKFHISQLAFTHRFIKPSIIRTARYFQYFTHHLNRPSFRVVISNKLEDQRPFLEMMLNAFFNISSSISDSLSRFSNSMILRASSFSDCTPLPRKLDSPFCWYSFRQRYNNKGSTPNSCASSYTFLRSKLNLTAFSLNVLS